MVGIKKTSLNVKWVHKNEHTKIFRRKSEKPASVAAPSLAGKLIWLACGVRHLIHKRMASQARPNTPASSTASSATKGTSASGAVAPSLVIFSEPTT